jgi:hypothetical protein
LTRFVAWLAFMEKVYLDLVELIHYVSATLTSPARKAASALALAIVDPGFWTTQ